MALLGMLSFIPPTLVISFGVICYDTPDFERFTIAGSDVATRQSKYLSAFHPLIVAHQTYWVNQIHASKC